MRIAVSVVFFLIGIGPGIWAVHIPLIQERLAINPAILGLALLTMAAGAVVSMPLSGWIVGRTGSRLPTAIGMIVYLIILPFPILSWTVPAFFVTLFVFGVLLGGLDVVANVQASEIETARQKPTMSSFHAFYSIGALSGALIGALVIGLGWGDGRGVAVAVAVSLIPAAFAVRNLFPGEPAGQEGPQFTLPSRAVLGLGLIALLAYALEGAITDWSALYLTTVREATPTTAAFGFALFALSMSAIRLFGDPIVARLGSRNILVGGGILAAIGLGTALVVPSPLLAALGFGIAGIGVANVVPVVFSAGAKAPGVSAGVGVASVATMGYAGFLSAPPILGFIGAEYGLSASLGIVLAMGLAIAVLGYRLK
ncbi:MFS transporter [Bauldia litoralis]|uniref:Fucose permease n=1 Tax=Bauldia litoralis TaxID=665467 RepID=A0A1G6B8V3_9HYPH|nr:MFS transporter [Bauldia litoralis]SDB17088.1 Fucose permease [Bauldia litoralis]